MSSLGVFPQLTYADCMLLPHTEYQSHSCLTALYWEPLGLMGLHLRFMSDYK